MFGREGDTGKKQCLHCDLENTSRGMSHITIEDGALRLLESNQMLTLWYAREHQILFNNT